MSDELTAAEAQKLVDADKQRRVQAAAEAIQSVLKEQQCDLVGVPQITAEGRIAAFVQIVAR